MAKLTKQQARLHRQACQLVDLERDLSEDEKEFVLAHWQESSTSANSLEGAFFTPLCLARDLAHHVVGDRIIDLGAGIGHLSWGCRNHWDRRWCNQPPREFVCVEKNPTYLRVGRKVLSEATWICADILDLPYMDLGRFDCAMANPPFGRLPRARNSPAYNGPRFEYHVIAVAAGLARRGAFLVPQTSAPFRYSGQPCYRDEPDAEYERFHRDTGITLEPSVGVDTTASDGEWRGVSPRTEVVRCDFTELHRRAVPLPAPSGSSVGSGEQLSLLTS